MLALEWRNALGRFRHGDNTNQSTFGLRPPHTHMHCCGPLGVLGSMKMFLEPIKYMRWHDTHFLRPCYRPRHTLCAYVLFCALTLPLFGAFCASKNGTHKFMKHALVCYHSQWCCFAFFVIVQGGLMPHWSKFEKLAWSLNYQIFSKYIPYIMKINVYNFDSNIPLKKWIDM